jgi:protein phosphatase
MKVRSAFFSQRGQKSRNEDFVLPPLFVNNSWWAAIADGMGGQFGGEMASTTAIAAVKHTVEHAPEANILLIFEEAREKLAAKAREDVRLSEMGTTLSVVGIADGSARIGHVGDSRIYHLRGEGIVARTVDQTEVQQLVAQGVLSKAKARSYPRRNILLSVLSATRPFELQQDTFQVVAGDRLVLLTDGVSSKLLRREIRDISLSLPDTQAFCTALKERVSQRNPRDDYSAICMDIIG